MKKRKFWLDLVWLVLIAAVLVVGDYRRREAQREQQFSISSVREPTGNGAESSQARVYLPMSGTVQRTF